MPGRSRPRDAEAAPRWQQYQSALLESGGVANWGAETRALYRACLRSLRGADEGTAAAVRQHARANIAQHAGAGGGVRCRERQVCDELCCNRRDRRTHFARARRPAGRGGGLWRSFEHEPDGGALCRLLVGGRHDLEELCRCLGSALGEETRGEG